jgi:hypothetical protein
MGLSFGIGVPAELVTGVDLHEASRDVRLVAGSVSSAAIFLPSGLLFT